MKAGAAHVHLKMCAKIGAATLAAPPERCSTVSAQLMLTIPAQKSLLTKKRKQRERGIVEQRNRPHRVIFI